MLFFADDAFLHHIVRAQVRNPCVSLHCPSFRTCARSSRSGRFFVADFVLCRGMEYSDALLTKILRQTRCIACVGVSANPVRPSYFVALYLGLKGFRIIPVNPGLAGQMLFGETVYPDLAGIPGDVPVDMVDVFRRSEHVPPIVDAALEHLPKLRTIWMQIGVQHSAAAAKAEASAVTVIQNRCPKIEYQRLFGELRMGGFNTGVISSRL